MDPIIIYLLTICLSVLFASAATHKVINRSLFYDQLAAYRLLPGFLVGFGVFVLPIIEFSLATALLIPFMSKLALGGSALLLGLYAMVMLSAIIRGNGDIDCGCAGAEGATAISAWHIVRNLLLSGTALAGSLPMKERLFTPYDWVFMLLMAMTFIAFYQAGNQLLANRSHLKPQGVYR